MTDFEEKRCFICGKYGSNSKDHIPPKNLCLSKNRNKGHQLLTVPTHSDCNKSYSKDDEYFQFFMTIPGSWSDPKALELWEQKIFKGLSRPESKRYLKYISSAIEPTVIFDANVGDSINTAIFHSDSDRINRVFERIVRGIYYFETKNIMPLDHVVLPMYPKSDIIKKRREIMRTDIHKSFCDNSFEYWWNRAVDQPDALVFWLRFFRKVNIVLFSMNKDIYKKGFP